MYKVIVLENDELSLNKIRKSIKGTLIDVKIYEPSHSNELFSILDEEVVDLLVINYDAKLLDANCDDLASVIHNLCPNLDIIALADDARHLDIANKHEVFYYFMKPYQAKYFCKRLKEWSIIHQTCDHRVITLNCDGESLHIPLKQILYLEKIDRQVKIKTPSNVYYTNESLRKLTDRLDERFYLCHQSYVVNTEKIVSIEKGNNRPKVIKLFGVDDEILLSRYKLKEFNEYMQAK